MAGARKLWLYSRALGSHSMSLTHRRVLREDLWLRQEDLTGSRQTTRQRWPGSARLPSHRTGNRAVGAGRGLSRAPLTSGTATQQELSECCGVNRCGR